MKTDWEDFIGLFEFLRDYPLMAVRPMTESDLILEGQFWFGARSAQGLEIIDRFDLRIEVPRAFPKHVPRVTETDERIPRTGRFHVNSDNTLCLGSPLRLRFELSQAPTLSGFADKCLVPYLFAVSHSIRTRAPLPFGELAHGSAGKLGDYAVLLGVSKPRQAQQALRLLGMKRRVANKHPCPCGCQLRLGRCKLSQRFVSFRRLASRSWFRDEATASEQNSEPSALHSFTSFYETICGRIR